jgi:hypothetical protein
MSENGRELGMNDIGQFCTLQFLADTLSADLDSMDDFDVVYSHFTCHLNQFATLNKIDFINLISQYSISGRKQLRLALSNSFIEQFNLKETHKLKTKTAEDPILSDIHALCHHLINKPEVVMTADLNSIYKITIMNNVETVINNVDNINNYGDLFFAINSTVTKINNDSNLKLDNLTNTINNMSITINKQGEQIQKLLGQKFSSLN